MDELGQRHTMESYRNKAVGVTMLNELEKKLGYTFNNKQLLEAALTHRSFGKENNERLEFLGDSILNFTIGEQLFNQFPTAAEGQLSRLRANLVRGETLTKVAKELELGPHLRLGTGEQKSGGEQRTSILADSVEAIIAAIYLDANMETCQQQILIWFKKYLNKVSLDRLEKDPKSELQEFLQSKQLPLPEYELINVSGKDHAQIFEVACKVAPLEEPMTAKNTSRRKAEQDAAAKTLSELRNDTD